MTKHFSIGIAAALICSLNVSAQQVLPFVSETIIVHDTLQKASGGDSIVKIEETPLVTVVGIGSTESLELEKLTAAGAVCANLTLHKYVSSSLSFNYGAAGTKNEKSDSVPLSMFYFPDLANLAFAGAVEIHTSPFGNNGKHQWAFATEVSLQRRNIQRDSMIYEFGIVNYNLGPKYRWVYEKNDHRAVFTAGICYNYVSINRNNSDAFTTLFNNYQTPDAAPVKRYFHGLSFMTSLQLDRAMLFARTYTDFNQSNDLAFTVGIKASAELFSF